MRVSRGHLSPTRGGSSKPFWACFPLRAGRGCHVTRELASTAFCPLSCRWAMRQVQSLGLLCDGCWPQLSPWSMKSCDMGCVRGTIDAAAVVRIGLILLADR